MLQSDNRILPYFKGDCLVDFDGNRLWVKPAELRMIEQSKEPRPSTREEIRAINRRKAYERKAKLRAKKERAVRVALPRGPRPGRALLLGLYPIVTLEKQLPNMILNLG